MAHGSWSGIYNDVQKGFVQNGRRLELEVLMGLSWFADSYGFCYPGIKRLATVLRRGHTTVERALNSLIEWNIIKMHVTENRMRRGKPQVDYQINPFVLYIREDLETVAWEAWGENRAITPPFSADLNDFGADLSTTREQPDRIQNQNQTQDPKPRPKINPEPEPQNASLKKGAKTGDSPNDENSAKAPKSATESDTNTKTSAQAQKQRDSATSQRDEVAVAESETHVPPAAGEGEAKLSAYAVPLADFESEQLAQYLRTHLPTQLKQARALVDTYGIAHVNKGIEWLTERQRIRHVQNPAGLFVWGIQNGEIPKPESQEENRLLSGKYSDFFER